MTLNEHEIYYSSEPVLLLPKCKKVIFNFRPTGVHVTHGGQKHCNRLTMSSRLEHLDDFQHSTTRCVQSNLYANLSKVSLFPKDNNTWTYQLSWLAPCVLNVEAKSMFFDWNLSCLCLCLTTFACIWSQTSTTEVIGMKESFAFLNVL